MIELAGAFAVALLLAGAALGFGAALLAACGLAGRVETRLSDAVALALGVGLLGWWTFFLGIAGLLSRPWLAALALFGLAGLWLRRPVRAGAARETRGGRALLAAGLVVLAVVAMFDLAEALAPPADADSLAYHFGLPKQFLAAGRIAFVPRALDGAAPLLLQATYLVALGLGGEKAMTLWAGLLGWLPAALLYGLARRHLSRLWSLALALVLVTTPAVVYGGGAGQVDVKLAFFVLVAGLAIAEAARTGNARWAALAGLAAGFFLASKLTGLFVVGAGGLALILLQRRLGPAIVFGLAALVAGFEWYFWTWWHTGDPLFPVLYAWLGAPEGYWSAASTAYFQTAYAPEEIPAPRSLVWLLLYPFAATLGFGFNGWEAGRTGLGPYGLLVLPATLLGLWRYRRGLHRSPLAAFALVIALFYVVWFFSATSQRVRHLAPFYPALILCMTVPAVRWTEHWRVVPPLAAAAMLTIAVQLGGATVFGLNYLRFHLGGESREAFLRRNVALYGPVPWINAHLGPGDHILITHRQLTYVIDVPVYGAFARFQYLVDLLPGDSNPQRFRAELERLGVTHILLTPSLADFARGVREPYTDELESYTGALVAAGCARVIHSEEMWAPRSRTLPGLDARTISSDVVAVDPATCRL